MAELESRLEAQREGGETTTFVPLEQNLAADIVWDPGYMEGGFMLTAVQKDKW